MNYEPLCVCDKYMISFGTRKNIIVLSNTSHVDSRDIYLMETTKNAMKVMKDKLLVSNIMKHFLIHQYVHNVLKFFGLVHPTELVYMFTGDYTEEKSDILYFLFTGLGLFLK